MKHLFKQQLILLLLLLAFTICHAQPNSNYFQDFVLANHKIYVFHADGILKIFDDDSGKLLDTYSPNTKIRLLTQDHKGNVVIADSTNHVKRLNAENKWIPIAYYQGVLYKVVFDNNNDCFLITNKGVVDVQTQKLYIPDKKLCHSEWAYHGNNALESDDNVIGSYMDKDNNLWFSFWHGEWGTDMFILNTKSFDFIPFKNWIAMPEYEANGYLFARTRNFHDEYLVQYDKIYDQNKKLIEFVGSEAYSTEKDPTYQKAKRSHDKPHTDIKDPKKLIKELKELDSYNFYIGDFAFNPNDGKMYIISSEGLLIIEHVNRNTKFGDLAQKKTFIFPKDITKAYLYYSNVKHETKIYNGYPQYISKLQFTQKDKLVLLAPDNGVWLFDWKKLLIVE